ncbi:MAG: hypothetical protein IT158_13735 [Bryobacterales bacterium]|nr:hypothetical protein [Bryobacterales bacterium]
MDPRPEDVLEEPLRELELEVLPPLRTAERLLKRLVEPRRVPRLERVPEVLPAKIEPEEEEAEDDVPPDVEEAVEADDTPPPPPPPGPLRPRPPRLPRRLGTMIPAYLSAETVPER